jgi:hypothetical protein
MSYGPQRYSGGGGGQQATEWPSVSEEPGRLDTYSGLVDQVLGSGKVTEIKKVWRLQLSWGVRQLVRF